MKKFDRKGAPPRGRPDQPRTGRAGARPRPPFPAADAEVMRDPYQRVQRPRPAGTFSRPAGAFTVTLDPDVARVFRGHASVNKALRLVLQLMEVAAPRPRSMGAGGERGGPPRPAGGGYRGSPQARGFVRKPRFDEEEE